jgi:DNA (cytosine-5)-methyltransferase 1
MGQINEKVIPVVDLFAGPGGLGEGFAAFQEVGGHPFRIVLSIEKDTYAHCTLTLRAFFRQFKSGSVPEAYYDYLQRVDEPEMERRKCLYDDFPEQARKAQASVLLAELGYDDPGMDSCAFLQRFALYA